MKQLRQYVFAILIAISCCLPAWARVKGAAVLPPDPNGLGGGWGVGFIEVPLSAEQVAGPLTIKQITVTSPDKRVFYPSFQYSAPDPKVKEILTERPTLPPFVQGIVRTAMDSAQPKCRVYFLFTGTEPFQVVLGSQPPQAFWLTPQQNPDAYAPFMNNWLSLYFPDVNKKKNELSPGAPALLKNYLRAMLVYRMGLNPQSIAPQSSPWDDVSPFNFTAATPNLRAKMPFISFFEDDTLYDVSFEELLQKSSALNSAIPDESTDSEEKKSEENHFDGQKIMALYPVAADLKLPAPTIHNVPEDEEVQIEEIAMRVPKNCFYMRFGSFKNFLWFQDFNNALQGDMQNLIASQSIDRNNDEKIQTLLASRQTEMSRIMGPTVISDVAFVGADMFTDDGPSFGLLFHANNSFLLSSGITGERANYLKNNPDAKEKTIKIAGKKVKYIYTPDGRIHSYYAVDGMFHLISTSRTVVEDFFKTTKPEESLGGQKYFRYARSKMPLTNNYTIFAYASEDFLYRLLTPQYWTEISRRRRSVAEIEMVVLARQAAFNEYGKKFSIEDLVRYGFLPKSVLIRPDGSRLAFDDAGRIYDTKRGYPGLYRPAADMKVESMTAYEISRFEKMREGFIKNIVQFNPLMVGLTQQTQENDIERLYIDARVAPFARANFERTQSYFGPADTVRFAPVPGDCIQAQAILNNSRLMMGVRNEIPYQGSTGRPVADILGGIFGNDLGMYFITTNEAGFFGLLGTFNIAPVGPAQEYSIHSTPDIDMRYRDQRVKALSLQPYITQQIAPYLKYQNAPSPQQVWVSVNDPLSAPIGVRLNNMTYAMSARTTLHNLTILQTMVQQFGVPADKVKELLEKQSSATLVSPIGGKYVYVQNAQGQGFLTDTALGSATARNLGWFSVQAPQGYVAQPWSWFRGGDFRLNIQPDAVVFGATIDMTLPKEK